MADEAGAAVTKGKGRRLIIMGVGGVIVAACLGFAAKILLEEDAKPPAKPVAQAPKPAAEAPKPGAEAPKPGAEAPKPAAEAPKPAAAAPAAAAKPAAEAPKPAAAAPAKPGAAKPGAAGPDAVARGSVVIPGNYAWDARTNSIGTGGDLLWQQRNEKERSLNPQGRAVLAVTDQNMAFGDMGATEVATFPYSSTPIPGSDGLTALDPGAVLGLRTQDGDYLKVRVVRYYDSHDFSFKSAEALPAKWKDLQKGRPKVARFSIELEWVAYPGAAIAAAKAAEARKLASAPPPAPAKPAPKEPAKEPAPMTTGAAEAPAEKSAPEQDDKPKPVAIARPPRPEPPSMPGPRYADVMTAVLYKDSEGVAELLALGKWVDRPDSRGKTPLMVAVMNDDAVIAEQLLKGGADASRGMSVAREFRNQPMQALMLRYGGR